MRKVMEKKSAKIIIALVCILVLVVVAVALAGNDASEEVTYRETAVEYGELVVGVTESGSVDIGTVDQVFELDMSALQRAETTGSSGSRTTGGSGGTAVSAAGSTVDNSGFGVGMSGGMSGTMSGGMIGSGITGSTGSSTGSSGGIDMFSQIFNMAGGGSSASTDTIGNLTVSEVCVSVGQQVQEGDVLFLLNEETVTELKEELESNVDKAKADLEAVYADQEMSKLTAQYTYDSSVAYGEYADTEYNNTIKSLQDAVTEKEEALAEAKELLAGYQAQLTQAQADYAAAAQVLKNCTWSVDNTDKWDDTWGYVSGYQLMISARNSVDTLEQKVEQLERNVEQAEQNVDTCTTSLSQAKRSLESGKLNAQQTLELRQLAYDTAQETYDIAQAYLEDTAASQEEVYAEAQEKWDEFSSHIDGNAVRAKYNGVITSVNLEVGDSIGTNDTLVTLYDTDSVEMTITVDEDDMTDVAVGTEAKISLTAYPDTIFRASVSEISDASTDSGGNVTYEVTVILSGDVSGLFQGMTGDVTLITRRTEDVLYVSNRAIIREGTDSYVKIKDASGNIVKQKVTTGFSDGENAEIIEGLSEGDVVLIESKVNKS